MKKKWTFSRINNFGGKVYMKGNKSLLIFPHRIFMWTEGKDAIIRERYPL